MAITLTKKSENWKMLMTCITRHGTDYSCKVWMKSQQYSFCEEVGKSSVMELDRLAAIPFFQGYELFQLFLCSLKGHHTVATLSVYLGKWEVICWVLSKLLDNFSVLLGIKKTKGISIKCILVGTSVSLSIFLSKV